MPNTIGTTNPPPNPNPRPNHPSSRCNLRSQGPPAFDRLAGKKCLDCNDVYSNPIIVNCGHCFCLFCLVGCIIDFGMICAVCKNPLVMSLFISNKEFTKRIPQGTTKI